MGGTTRFHSSVGLVTNDEFADRRGHLAALLGRFAPTDGEMRAHDEMIRLNHSSVEGSALRSHRYLPGHFTAGAFVTDRHVERVLLIHHGKLDIWVQPGGHIEPSDATVLGAAMREATEETGVVGLDPGDGELFDVDVHPIPRRGDAPPHRHYDLRFHLVTDCEVVHLTDEVKGVRWTPLDDVPFLTTDPSVMRPVGKLRRLAASGQRL